ncbi:hypothetical protein M3Y96_00326200 [Aphelenchoides besseyi]|nr:hypothetical protein M3Y96_00326200 [Aphelenchoides besseyi]
MQMFSTFEDPNVAVWQIENFAKHYEQSIEEDELTSSLFAFEHPEAGKFDFSFKFEPKTSLDSSSLSICLESRNVYSKFSMECSAWLETIDKKRSELKRGDLEFSRLFVSDSLCPFLSSTQMSEFSHLSTVFVCFRLPFPVKLMGSISTKSTVYRWLITDYEYSFDTPYFDKLRRSDEFTVSEFKSVSFMLEFYPNESYLQREVTCAIYLNVIELAGYSKLPIHFDLWIENSKSRLPKSGHNYVFSSDCSYGSLAYVTELALYDFAQNGPFNICCDVRPIVDPIPLPNYFSFNSEMSSLFNDPYFSDAEIHVSRAILACKSSVFRAIFNKKTEEQKSGVVTIKGFEAAMVEKMLVYVYKYELVNLKDIALKLLPVADCYQVNSLVKKCTDSLVDNLTIDNVLLSLKLAFEHEHLKEFKDQVLEFAHENWKEIHKLPESKKLLVQVPDIAIELLALAHI